VIEICLRIAATGFRRYFRDSWNCFDTFCVAASAMGILLVFAPRNMFGGHNRFILPRILMFVRQIRLLRLLHVVGPFREITESMATVIPDLSIFFVAISVIFYEYAILGLGLFRNIRLPQEEYVANDFSTFTTALLTLFELMIVNDWNKTMESFTTATASKWTQLYFIVWYFFFVVVVLNQITSFVVEAFTAEHRQRSVSIKTPTGASAHREEFISRNNLHQLGLKISSSRRGASISRLLNNVFDSEVDTPTEAEVNSIVDKLRTGL